MGWPPWIALVGIGLAYLIYVRQPAMADHLARRFRCFFEILAASCYFDEIYEFFVVQSADASFSHVCRKIVDAYLLDGLVDLLARISCAARLSVSVPVQMGTRAIITPLLRRWVWRRFLLSSVLLR